jgi:ABC-type Fe3+-hydroxamate transport system substrate-binding protein
MRRAIIAAAVLAALVAAAALLSCDRGPRSQTPQGGGQVRLAVLSPALGVVIRDIGAADLAVARHGWDVALDPKLPIGGDQAGLDYEALLGAQPTHVLLEWRGEPPARLLRIASDRGWEVLNYQMLSLEETLATADDLHERFAPAPKGPAPSEQVRQALRARPGGYPTSGRVLLLAPGVAPAALGPGSFHHEILVRLGAQPAVTEGAPWITLDAEDMLDIAPDSIVLVEPRPRGAPPQPRSWDDLAAKLGRASSLPIPAVEHRRVALMDEPEDLTPSTAMIDWARRLREILDDWEK